MHLKTQWKSLYLQIGLKVTNLFTFRRSVRLVRMARGTILMNGPFCAPAQFGSVRSLFGSATQPLRLCCLWPVNSTADLFMAREKCTEWWSAVLTATGEQWRASLWNQVRLDSRISPAHNTLSFRGIIYTVQDLLDCLFQWVLLFNFKVMVHPKRNVVH